MNIQAQSYQLSKFTLKEIASNLLIQRSIDTRTTKLEQQTKEF